MGYAIAQACANQGAEVILVSGPVHFHYTHSKVKIIRADTARQMYDACISHFSDVDAAVLSAAVADFSPSEPYNSKLKRSSEELIIRFSPTDDIAAELGKRKTKEQVLVGFALETTDEVENAIGKMRRKNFDFIVLNSFNDQGAGFGGDTNKITIIDKNNNIDKFELKSKNEVASDIVDKLTAFMI